MSLTRDERLMWLKTFFPSCKIEEEDSIFKVTINVKKFVNLFIKSIEGDNITYFLKLNHLEGVKLINYNEHYKHSGSASEIVSDVLDLLDFYCWGASEDLSLDGSQISYVYSKEDVADLVQYFIAQFKRHNSLK